MGSLKLLFKRVGEDRPTAQGKKTTSSMRLEANSEATVTEGKSCVEWYLKKSLRRTFRGHSHGVFEGDEFLHLIVCPQG